jgi:predicted  nucleic acid-binding Zn-ribbon protein
MGLKSIFQEGMKERRRKKSLRSKKNEFKSKEKSYGEQLTALGKKAWEAKIDISIFGDLKAALGNVQKNLDDLRAQAEKLLKQKGESEAVKKQENDRLNSGQNEMEEKKRDVDRRLNEKKNAWQALQKEAEQATSRLAAIAVESTRLGGKTADTATAETEKNEIAKQLASLAKEGEELKARIKEKEESSEPINLQIAPLQEETGQLQKQIESIRAEQKKMSAEMDQKIVSLTKEMDGTKSKITESEKMQNLDFNRLGEKLATAQHQDPNIAKEIAAARTVKTEMEGIQSLMGGLERQKDESQVSAYKKMMAIIISGIVLLTAIIAALFILLAPKKNESPFGALGGHEGAAAASMENLAQQMQKGFGGIKAESEKIQGKKIIAAAEVTLKAVLPSMAGWQMENPSYSRGTVGELETAHLQTEYAGPESRKIHVNITDAGGASALLVPVKMLFAMKITIDNEETYQKVSVYNNIPVAERYDKRNQEASFGVIIRDRYLIELKTKAENGLELLKDFMNKLDFSQLVP